MILRLPWRMIFGVGPVRSTMVDGKCPVRDFGVPPFGLAEVNRMAPLFSKSSGKIG